MAVLQAGYIADLLLSSALTHLWHLAIGLILSFNVYI